MPFRQTELSRGGTKGDFHFLVIVFLGAFLVRLIVGTAIYESGKIAFFAGDVETYDHWGWGLARYWQGELQNPSWVLERIGRAGQNGMYYWVAILYFLFGHNLLAATIAQIFVVSFTPLLAHKISFGVFGSRSAARVAAILVAFMPSMVVWSCTLLKDPIVVLLLSITVLYCVRLQQGGRLLNLLPALAAAVLVFPFRGYVFYFIVVSVMGSLLLARSPRGGAASAVLTRITAVLLVAGTLFYFGFDRIAADQLNPNVLESLSVSRQDLAQRAHSGFLAEARVTDLAAAMRVLPSGLANILFAPFPWETGGARFQLALPEMLLWYTLFPFCVVGLAYAVRRHLRRVSVIVLFALQLTLFYAIFIGNVGTAHRQRSQVFVFYLILAGAGIVYVSARHRGRIGIEDA